MREGRSTVNEAMITGESEPVRVSAGPSRNSWVHGCGTGRGAGGSGLDLGGKGHQTVTVVLDGALEHGDSRGNAGVLGPGDVQWMTAASGIIHEEYHSPAFAKTGGPFRMIQLWVNLPAADKLMRPRYQEIPASSIPVGPQAQVCRSAQSGTWRPMPCMRKSVWGIGPPDAISRQVCYRRRASSSWWCSGRAWS